MRIALTYDLRGPAPARPAGAGPGPDDDDDEEFDSPATIDALAGVLTGLGHDVARLGDGEPALRRLLERPRPDLVFNIAEGLGVGRAREARLPAALEMLGIPYTGSDPLTLAATLDKDCAKRLVASAGVAVPRGVLLGDGRVGSAVKDVAALGTPVIVKPTFEGSSKGILGQSLVDDPARVEEVALRVHRRYRQPVLVEEFVAGDELTVGIVGNRPPGVLGILGVVPRTPTDRFVYSLEVKRDWKRLVRYDCPARIAPEAAAAVRESALAAWQVLGMRDLGRIDFRLRDGVPYFLEANPLPGLSPEYSDLAILGRHVGVEYPELIARILGAALERLAGQA